MKTTLMNFGDNTRVVSNEQNEQVTIPTGAIMTAEIHDVHYQMIRNSPNDTLIIVPAEVKPTKKLRRIMALMPDVLEGDVSEITAKFVEMAGPHPDAIQPTRQMIALALRELAREEVVKTMARAVMAVNIREEGDKKTRQPVEPDTKPNKGKAKPQVDDPDDKALSILVPEAAKAKKRVIVRERL